MSTALERADQLIREGQAALLDARLEDFISLMHMRCLKHDTLPLVRRKDGQIVFFCGCQRRPTRLE
jgi:hypothetical protein